MIKKLVVGLASLGVLVTLLGCGSSTAASPARSVVAAPALSAATFDPAQPHPGIYARNAPELKLPLNYLDIEKLFGKPTSTQLVGATQMWYYSNVTYDPITDKLDSKMQVVIEDRLVTAINYY